MFHCVNCGVEISEQQYNKFDHMCSECIRLAPLRKQAKIQIKSTKGAWYFLGFICIASIIFVIIFSSIFFS